MLYVCISILSFERRPDVSVAFANSDGGPRALSQGTTPIGGAANNSVESCTQACFNAGFTLAGVEYSDECCALTFPLLKCFYLIGPFPVKTAQIPSVALAFLRLQATAT